MGFVIILRCHELLLLRAWLLTVGRATWTRSADETSKTNHESSRSCGCQSKQWAAQPSIDLLYQRSHTNHIPITYQPAEAVMHGQLWACLCNDDLRGTRYRATLSSKTDRSFVRLTAAWFGQVPSAAPWICTICCASNGSHQRPCMHGQLITACICELYSSAFKFLHFCKSNQFYLDRPDGNTRRSRLPSPDALTIHHLPRRVVPCLSIELAWGCGHEHSSLHRVQ